MDAGMGRDSVVGLASVYGLDCPGIESRCGRGFRIRLDRPPSPLLYNGYRVALGVKRPGRGVSHRPASSAEVKERAVLCICNPSSAIMTCYKVNFTFYECQETQKRSTGGLLIRD